MTRTPHRANAETPQVKKLMGISANHDPMHSVGGVVGIAIGLAVTGVGGRVLFVEASKSQGKGKIQVTGQLGSVMSESVYAAFSFIKAHWLQMFKYEYVYFHFDVWWPFRFDNTTI